MAGSFLTKVVFHLDYRRAIRDEVVAHFSVALVGVAFNDIERIEYDELSRTLNRSKKELICSYDVPDQPFGDFFKRVTCLSEGGFGRATQLARNYLGAFSKRRDLLAETDAKRVGLRKLLNAIHYANRVIIFTQTIDSAVDITQFLIGVGISADNIHSSMNKETRRSILKNFADDKLHVIVAPRVLDGGVDVPEADFGIIVATSRTRRQMIQRMGRVLRRKADGRLARFVLLYVENTSEDPNDGAHEEFISDITDVADSVRTFAPGSDSSSLCEYLNQIVSSRMPKLPPPAYHAAMLGV